HRSELKGRETALEMSGAENQNESAKRSVPNFDWEDGGEKADARRRVHTAVGKARNRVKGGGCPASTYTRAPAPPGPVSTQKAEAAKAPPASTFFLATPRPRPRPPLALAIALASPQPEPGRCLRRWKTAVGGHATRFAGFLSCLALWKHSMQAARHPMHPSRPNSAQPRGAHGDHRANFASGSSC